MPRFRPTLRGTLTISTMFLLGALSLWAMFQAPRGKPPVVPTQPVVGQR